MQISAVKQENENLEEEIRNLENAPYSIKPYLVTKLGWCLHNSSDPIDESKRTFTIYGYVFNVGATNYSCYLQFEALESPRVFQLSGFRLELPVNNFISFNVFGFGIIPLLNKTDRAVALIIVLFDASGVSKVNCESLCCHALCDSELVGKIINSL